MLFLIRCAVRGFLIGAFIRFVVLRFIFAGLGYGRRGVWPPFRHTGRRESFGGRGKYSGF